MDIKLKKRNIADSEFDSEQLKKESKLKWNIQMMQKLQNKLQKHI